MTGAGVPAGAASANQPSTLYCGRPASRRGRRVGQRREPHVAGDRKRRGAVGVDRPGDVRVPLEAELHLPGNQVGAELRDVAIGHVGELHAGHLAEVLAGQMLRRADADRSVVERAGLLLGALDQLLERLDAELVADRHHDGEAGERRDDGQLLQRVVAEVLVEREVGGDRAGARADQRVAVRRRPRGLLRCRSCRRRRACSRPRSAGPSTATCCRT